MKGVPDACSYHLRRIRPLVQPLSHTLSNQGQLTEHLLVQFEIQRFSLFDTGRNSGGVDLFRKRRRLDGTEWKAIT